MSKIELEYRGMDIVISRDMAEKYLGLHPGDRVEIRPKVISALIEPSSDSSKELAEALEHLRDAFDPSELDAWDNNRKNLWSVWKVPV